MGSPYLIAHGLGTPVADANPDGPVPADGTYRVWGTNHQVGPNVSAVRTARGPLPFP